MKKYVLILAALVILVSSFNVAYSQESFKVAEIKDGEVNMILDEEMIIEAVEQTLGDGTEIQRVEILYSSNASYLACYGILAENSHNIAFELEEVDNVCMMISAGAVTHTCTGDPCVECDFNRDDNQKITGCRGCKSFLGVCNHSKSTTQASIFMSVCMELAPSYNITIQHSCDVQQ